MTAASSRLRPLPPTSSLTYTPPNPRAAASWHTDTGNISCGRREGGSGWEGGREEGGRREGEGGGRRVGRLLLRYIIF